MHLAREGYVDGLHIKVEGPVPAVPANAGGLNATKGRGQMAHVLGVDPHHAGFKLIG